MRICLTWILAVSVLAYSTPAWASSQHVVDVAAMRQAIADQQADRAADRAAVKRLLDRADARELAAELGLDLQRADRALAEMNSEDLARLAASARAMDLDIAGGQSTTIVISTTTVLLLIILILLIAN